ncbi:MAG: class I tRNA ligase family protein, partial [Patescibacteria group bacterium]
SRYLENLKSREDKDAALAVFRHIFLNCLKLLHPFMPFITEEIWSNLPKEDTTPLVVSSWPK